MQSSTGRIKIPLGKELSEVKLCGKLDLSMWRGGGDDEDEDNNSSIDFSLSPKSPPGVINSNNQIKDIIPPLLLQPPPVSSDTSQPKSSNFLFPLSPGDKESRSPSATSGYTGLSGCSGISEESELQLSKSHNKENRSNHVVHETRLDEAGKQIIVQLSEQIIKGGVKKVEFSKDTVKTGMVGEAHSLVSRERSKRPDSSGRGNRASRSFSSGHLLTEIRKMSLASQDAEEEKKKQAASGGNVSPPPKKGSRRYRRKRRREEEYTDKDRAAAVTLGSRDIKQSLKAKKKRDRKMRLSIDLMSSEDYLSSMLVVEASYQMKVKKQPNAALATLNKALEIQPTHKAALVARSQCHLRLGDANSALKDAETSFDKNETFIQGLFQYAEALYQLGEFEKALIAYHQGYRLRKDMEGFRIGVQKSQEAIRRAIGDRSATKMGNLDEILSIIGELDENKKKTIGPYKDEELLINILKKRFGDKACLQIQKSKPKNQWITREVLGQMYLDKDYLAKFIHRPDVKKQMGHADALRENAMEGLKYLESREQFWRQQNPLYSRKSMASMINSNSLLNKIAISASPSVTPKPFKVKKEDGLQATATTPRSAFQLKHIDSNNNLTRCKKTNSLSVPTISSQSSGRTVK